MRNLSVTRHRVLVADYDTPFARQLADYLWSLGYECRIAGTISEAMGLLENWKPDSIFIDLMLPETNALTLCRSVRSSQSVGQPKIVVMSRQFQRQGIETSRRAGADHCLLKPTELDEVFRSSCLTLLGN